MIVNQVFELSMMLESEKFQEVLERYYCGEDFLNEEKDYYLDLSYEKKGIATCYRNSTYQKKVKITVNTAVLMNGEKGRTEKMIPKLDKHLSKYFNNQYCLDDFALAKVSFITDLDIGNQEKLKAYLKVLQRIGKVKKFSPSECDHLDNACSWKGNSNATDFLIYDLNEVIENVNGVLRAEAHLKKPKAIRTYTSGYTTSEQITELMEKSKDILLSVMTRIIPYGGYYKKAEALEILHREVSDIALRRRMIHLLTLIPEKKSLLLSQ